MGFYRRRKNVIAKTLCGILEEEKAIDTLSLKVPKGRYILGYFKTNGTKKLFKNSRQIVN